ncbi:MAG: class I SAM-dependent methyltransferase [Candidatus Odinarchaeota archaeon]
MITDPELQIFAIELTKKIIPEVEKIVDTYKNDTEQGFSDYVDFIESVSPSLQKMIKGLNNITSIGVISPRLLRDPHSTWIMDRKSSSEEEEAHVAGYLKAIVQLVYCIAKGLEGWQFSGTALHEESLKTRNAGKISTIPSLIQIVKQEIIEVKPSELLKTAKRDSKRIKEERIADNEPQEWLWKDKKQVEVTETLQRDDEDTAVPFTARLMAYYRAQENKKESPLIADPFAERLAGDMVDYVDKHRHTAGSGDYPLVRSHYIEKNLLTPWCNTQVESQIVLLGSGLDTRAYRFKPLLKNKHAIFEIDFPVINRYKEEILRDEQPYCRLVRMSMDLSNPYWADRLVETGFSSDLPTFWVLEGLIYYMERELVTSLLETAARTSAENSQIFADICVPALADLVFGPFTSYFKWGLDKTDVQPFFAKAGWNVTCSFADDHAHGRNVGQRGLIFVQGIRAGY